MPRRRGEVARSTLAIAFPPSRGQLSLPQQTDALPSCRTVLSKAGRRSAGCGRPEYEREGQQVQRFYIHVGFYDMLYAFQQNLLASKKRTRGEEEELIFK